MTSFLWIALGMSASASLLHAALGLRHPLQYQHVAFATLMALLTISQLCDLRVYRAASFAAAAPWSRASSATAVALLASYAWFLRAYARIEVPRILVWLFGTGLAAMIWYVATSSVGLTIGAAPRFVGLPQPGQTSWHVIVSEIGLVQVAYSSFVAAVVSAGILAGMQMYQRGQRWQGVLLCAAVSPVVVAIAVDLAIDLMGKPRLDLTKSSAIALSVSMSFQLATEFRINEQRLQLTLRRVETRTAELAAMIGASLVVRDKLNTPLQTLSLGIAMLPERTAEEKRQLASLQRILARIVGLGRAVEVAANDERSTLARAEPPQ